MGSQQFFDDIGEFLEVSTRSMRKKSKGTKNKVEGFIKENPLAAVGGAFVIGYLVGLMSKKR